MLAHAIGDSGLQVRDHMTWFKHQMSRTDASHTFARTVAMKSMSMAVSCRLRLSRQTMQRALSSYASTCCLRHGQDSTRTTCTYSASTQKLPTPGVEAVWVCAYTSSVLDMKVALWELGAAVPFCAAFFFLTFLLFFDVFCWVCSAWGLLAGFDLDTDSIFIVDSDYDTYGQMWTCDLSAMQRALCSGLPEGCAVTWRRCRASPFGPCWCHGPLPPCCASPWPSSKSGDSS